MDITSHIHMHMSHVHVHVHAHVHAHAHETMYFTPRVGGLNVSNYRRVVLWGGRLPTRLTVLYSLRAPFYKLALLIYVFLLVRSAARAEVHQLRRSSQVYSSRKIKPSGADAVSVE